MKKAIHSAFLVLALGLSNAQSAQAVPTTPDSAASVASHTATGDKLYCSMTLDALQTTVNVRPGFTAAICLPSGVNIQHVITQAEYLGWKVTLPWSHEPRMFIAAGIRPMDTNMHLNMSDGSQLELIIKKTR